MSPKGSSHNPNWVIYESSAAAGFNISSIMPSTFSWIVPKRSWKAPKNLNRTSQILLTYVWNISYKCMLVLLKYDETSPVYYILNISIPKCHFPFQNVLSTARARAPQRERRSRRRDLERFLLFCLEIEKNWIRRKSHVKSAAENQQERVPWKFSLESPWYECSQTGEIVISIVWCDCPHNRTCLQYCGVVATL